MSRLIIENRTDRPDDAVLPYVGVVIGKGRISDNGRAYCYCTVFNDDVAVSAFRNKASDRFVVHYNDGVDHGQEQ